MKFENNRFCGDSAAHRRATYKGCGYDPSDLNRPHIGIANTFNEGTPGHAHLRPLADAIKAGVWQAGGMPVEFGVPSSCANITLGTSCMSFDLAMRDVVAASVELVAQLQLYDGLVLTASCDNIVPGMLLAAARLDIPTVIFTGGPMLAGHIGNKPLLLGDINELVTGDVAKGDTDKKLLIQKEYNACPTFGACPLMGTANTMQIISEALGMAIPGSSTIPAVYTDKFVGARQTGKRIVQMVEEGLLPSKIITKEALENAMRVDLAITGSTNAPMHLIAIANELDIDLTLDEFDAFSRTTPCITNIRPFGKHSVDELHASGGLPAICKQLEPLLHTNCLTVSGKTWGDVLDGFSMLTNDIIHSIDNPISPYGGLAVLKGNLAEYGALIRASTVREEMQHFKGPARVFHRDEDAFDAIVNGSIKPGDVIVIRYVGPVGAPGMLEVMLTADALLAPGMERVGMITDGRFSGFNHGPIVGHVSPEAAIGGTIALVEEDDMIEMDISARKLLLHVDDVTLDMRRTKLVPPIPRVLKGFMRTYAKQCLRPDQGAAMQSWD